MVRRTISLTVGLGLVLGAPAAATSEVTRAPSIGAVAVDGATTAVVVGGDGPGGAPEELRLVGPEGVRRIPDRDAFGGAMVGDVQLAAGGGRVALARFDTEVFDSPTATASILTAGPAAGPFAEVTRCVGRRGLSRPSTAFPPAAPAIDAATVVWLACVRAEDRVRITGPAGTTTLRVGGRVWSLALAGRTLAIAWIERDDARGGKAHVRLVPLDGGAARDVRIPGSQPGIAVAGQADGTVVAVGGAVDASECATTTVDVIAPGSTAPRRLPIAGCGARVALGGGWLVTHRARDRFDEPDLVVLPLDGSQPPAVLDRGDVLGSAPMFAADAQRVAWIHRGCATDAVLTITFGEPVADARATCPVRLGAGRLLPGGRLRFTVRCPRGCKDSTISVPDSPTLVDGRSRPGTRAVTVRLRRDAVRRLRRATRPAVAVRVDGTPIGVDAPGSGERRLRVRPR